MNLPEAESIATTELQKLRGVPYAELRVRVISGEIATSEVLAESGRRYQLETQYFWDSDAEGPIRVAISIDDGGWRAFSPIVRDFIKARDGGFVGEPETGV